MVLQTILESIYVRAVTDKLIWFVIKSINEQAILEITYVKDATHTLIWFVIKYI